MSEKKRTVRLSKVARDFNIGIRTIIEFLYSKGYKIEPTPNTILSQEEYELIKTHFHRKRETGNQEYHEDLKVRKIVNKTHNPNEWVTGQIKFFDHLKGFGFIESWDDSQDYFIHISKVETQPINDNDYVVFKLGLSRNKPGTLEAIQLYEVSRFTKDPEYLIEQYLRYFDTRFRKTILKALGFEKVIKLLKNELATLSSIESDEQFSTFNKIIGIYTSFTGIKEVDDKIISFISNWLNKHANSDYLFKFWLKGIIQNLPDNLNIKTYFLKSDQEIRHAIFNRADSTIKKEVLKEIRTKEEPKDTLDFIVNHLKTINKIGYSPDIKLNLYNNEYWSDKIDHDLFIDTIRYFQEHLDDKEKLKLFLNSYLDSISKEYVISACSELKQEEIENILGSDLLTKTDAFKLISSYLEHKVDSLLNEVTDKEFVTPATNQDWAEYEDNQVKLFSWILKTAKSFLTETKYTKIESIIFDKVPIWLYILLWEEGYTGKILKNSISDYLLICENFLQKINFWIDNNLITKEEIESILKLNIQRFVEITNYKEYYNFYNHIKALIDLNVDVNSIDKFVSQSNDCFLKLINWLEGSSSKFNYDQYKTKLVFLSPDDQIKFLKKLFLLAHTNEFDLTVEKLSQLTRIDFNIFTLSEEFHPDIPLNISVDIVIEAIKSFVKNEKFLLDSELLKIILKDLTLNKTYKFKIRGLFEKCEGRYEAEYNWNTNGEVKKMSFGDNQFYFAIHFSPGEVVNEYNRYGNYTRFVPNENFEELREKVKQLPGRKWNPENQYWRIPSQYEAEVMQFARENKFFIDLEGSNYANNTHLAEMKKTEVPNGVTYCEGRLVKNKHQMFNREFWWCSNQPCFSNCETFHDSDSWKDYTLLDFLTILGYNLDDGNRVGDYIERGKYYQFISTINRFNRLLERLYCDECDHILFPIEDSHYAHYRVTRFHCENAECSEYHKEIYLHHCLNGKCNNIIDSRRSKKCPNGLYICSNEECICCCSHNMFERRLINLQSTGGYIPKSLRNAVDNKLGHLEMAVHFCYQCGKVTKEIGSDIFECEECGIQYDVSKNNFKRPHRYLKKDQASHQDNQPPDFDELYNLF